MKLNCETPVKSHVCKKWHNQQKLPLFLNVVHYTYKKIIYAAIINYKSVLTANYAAILHDTSVIASAKIIVLAYICCVLPSFAERFISIQIILSLMCSNYSVYM